MLLLDTSVLLWLLLDHPRLGRRTRNRIGEAAAVHLSAVSIAELTIKSMLGKIQLPDDFQRLAVDHGLTELPLTTAHATAIERCPELLHHDPFDRLLVAQAQCSGMELLTADRVLLGLGRDFIVDATQ